MPTKVFPLSERSKKRFKISWFGPWTKIQIFVDEKELWSDYGKKDIENWLEFDFGWKKLFVKLKKIWRFMPELEVKYDGKQLPWSPSDPKFWIEQTFWLIVGLWILNIVFGLLAWFGHIEVLKNMWLGAISSLYGVVFLVLSFWVKRFSYVALASVVLLSVLDFLFTGYFLIQGDGQISLLIIKIFILMFLVRGFGKMKEIKNMF